MGSLNLCQWLIDHKANVLSRDKFGRSPLILAIWKGHPQVASLLLKHGADFCLGDSSDNSPIHYAAAYGQPELIVLLEKLGAKIDALNMWKLSPLNVAVQKGHLECVRILLQFKSINVNCVNHEGKSLLSLAIEHMVSQTPSLVKLLLDKGADPTIADVTGNTPLHHLASYQLERDYCISKSAQKKLSNLVKSLKQRVATLLIAKGAKLDTMNIAKETPLYLAALAKNTSLFPLLAKSGLGSNGKILHLIAKHILDPNY